MVGVRNTAGVGGGGGVDREDEGRFSRRSVRRRVTRGDGSCES